MGPAGKVGGSKRPSPWDRAHAAEPPLRSELFSANQMEQHGLRLASADRLTPGQVPERLLARLAANEQVLIETCGMATTAVTAKPRVTPVYRLVVESLPGLRLEVDRLHPAPCLPAHWGALTIHYRYRETVYHMVLAQVRAGDGGATGVTVDGVEQDGLAVPLVDDRREHRVEVRVAVV